MDINFDNINVVNGGTMLLVTKENGDLECTDISIATNEEKEIINIFRKTFPKGKEWYKIVNSDVIELTQSEYDDLHPVIGIASTEEKLAATTKELEETKIN